jgi:hypothetical protein
MRQHIVIALSLSLVSLTACKPETPQYTVTDPKTGEKTKISIKDQTGDKTITIDTEEGGGTISVAEQGEPPKNLPAYVPLYPGAQYTGSFAASSNQKSDGGAVAGGMVSFTTSDTSEKVLAFYKDAFSKAGMKEQAAGDMGGMSVLSFSKGDNEQEGAQVMVTPDPAGGTQVQVMYSAAP